MSYLGDFREDAVVYIGFTTNDSSGGAVDPSSDLTATDVIVYKNLSATQKTGIAGITVTNNLDSEVGLHTVVIDTSVDTSDTGFWATSNDYHVVLAPDETIDSQSAVAYIGHFSIENRYNPVNTVVESEGSYTLKQATSVILAALAGETSAQGTVILTPNGNATRISADVSDYERTSMTLTPSS